jgi:hypothetical protein
MDRYGGPQSPYYRLHGGLYVAHIMDRYGGHHTVLTIALPGGLYLAIIIDRSGGPHTALTIALHGGY